MKNERVFIILFLVMFYNWYAQVLLPKSEGFNKFGVLI